MCARGKELGKHGIAWGSIEGWLHGREWSREARNLGNDFVRWSCADRVWEMWIGEYGGLFLCASKEMTGTSATWAKQMGS